MELSVSLDPVGAKSLSEFENYVLWLNEVDGISIHCDVMDGEFSSRKALSAEMYNFLTKNTENKIDVHLMITSPETKINPFLVKALWGSIRSISIHVEAVSDDVALSLIEKIKTMGVEGGVVIDLETDIEKVSKKILSKCEVITIMSVKAGASGQTCDTNAFKKLEFLKKNYPKARLIIDGGINEKNIHQAKQAGANTFVVGSAVYNAKNREGVISALQKVLAST